MKIPGFVKHPFTAGITISFFGTLPIGILNSCVFSLSYSRTVIESCTFAVGATLIEMLYLFGSLKLLNLINWNRKKERWLYLGMSIFLAGCTGFVAADIFRHTTSLDTTISEIHSPFLAGMSLSAINLLQIPFWIGWSVVLRQSGILKNSTGSKNNYFAGSGLGTLAGFAVFVILGYTAQRNLTFSPMILQCGVTAVFVASTFLAALKCFKLFRTRSGRDLSPTTQGDIVSG